MFYAIYSRTISDQMARHGGCRGSYPREAWKLSRAIVSISRLQKRPRKFQDQGAQTQKVASSASRWQQEAQVLWYLLKGF